ncbi:MAG: isoleucine--tRNA ligase [Deltaproteobacteria bacterium]|nr:isoleucine--tRNA ligase [Deltaproteobacteria bacterium]
MDYKSTLNLPQTAFPMKADLANREPLLLKKWQEGSLYQKILEKNKKGEFFSFHDGPPYANGNIHFGHILNKILKDFVVKYKNMNGFRSPFIPGWDCHGLPIEHQVDKELGPKKKTMSKGDIRRACREYASRYVTLQKEEFRRLGVLADWDNPYITMSPDYEATIAREFGKFVAAGSVYKGKKPVLWCTSCQTALAEAEIEYEEVSSPSIYVKFPLTDEAKASLPKLTGQKASLVIWTTTPWTLPANLAVALHPNYDYVAIKVSGEIFIVAKSLATNFMKTLDLEGEPEVIERFSGKQLERKKCHHPFLPRESLIILGNHVTMDAGTGCVHTAPGHGEEDFEIGKNYNLPLLTPVDARGRFTQEAGLKELEGLFVFEANKKIVDLLQGKNALVKEENFSHPYPHCWRCKKAVLFRATEQWFLSLSHNDLRGKALEAIRGVNWVPAWGRERIYGMIENRPDWCLSRQRSWGVPIVAFTCEGCGQILQDKKIIDRIVSLFEKEGTDIWFDKKTEELLPPGTDCPRCHGKNLRKEEDILDVWFDSGVSFAAVAEKRLSFPADLYLEGSDQHRGWFHSSLLASLGTRGVPPYKTVLTHGFVVDGEGKKYSKSAKNYLPPDKMLKNNGADVLRLWVAAEDYRGDIRISDEIIKRLAEAYRKIRNTARFILGNLSDFDPDQDKVSADSLWEIDRWALHTTQKLIERTRQGYEEFAFHLIFHEVNRFCTVDLSSLYLDILKDRLYTFAKTSPDRRAAQTALFEIITTLSRLIAPVLSFTADEIWAKIPPWKGGEASVHLSRFPTSQSRWIDEALGDRWSRFWRVRGEITKGLEMARQAKVIGNSLEARVTLSAEDETEALLQNFEKMLPDLLIVSQVTRSQTPLENPAPGTVFYKSTEIPHLLVTVEKAEGEKCARCWAFRTSVGKNPGHPLLCDRCREVLR